MNKELPHAEYGLSIWIVSGIHDKCDKHKMWKIKIAHKGPIETIKNEYDTDDVVFVRKSKQKITPGYITQLV